MIHPSDTAHKRRLIVLGSTGSIGVNTLLVAENLADQYEVVGLAAGRNADLLIEQARRFKPQAVAISNGDCSGSVAAALEGVQLYDGPDAARQLVAQTPADMLVAAIVGAAGLPATLEGIRKGMDIALANKETLVAAGELVMPLVKEHGVQLLPVDSEHSAIFQCIQSQEQRAESKEQRAKDRTLGSTLSALSSIKRIVLTASGGPFRTTPIPQMRQATVEQALKHPTWNMGAKITIDSATMMNKALEIIEAHWLFGLGADQIRVIIHPQSIAHSFVEFTDHSILAQLGPPDMKTPIQFALTWPQRRPGCAQAMDWTQLSRLEFEQPDHEKFPAIGLAYRVIALGGTSGAILNAANEEAVNAFLQRKIGFGRITDLAAMALDRVPSRHIADLQDVFEADGAARKFVHDQL